MDPKNEDYCIKIGYDSNKLPPDIPLNIDMSLAVIVCFIYIFVSTVHAPLVTAFLIIFS